MSDLAHRSYCVGTWHPHRDACTCGLALRTLASNLATAAGLCRAYRDGFGSGTDIALDPYHHERYWTPGCNRPAPPR